MKTIELMVDGKKASYEVAEEAWRFFGAMDADAALADEARSLTSAGDLAGLARAKGYVTTPEEVWQYLTVVAAARDTSGELSDEELDLVAGGLSACTATQVTQYCSVGKTNPGVCVCPP